MCWTPAWTRRTRARWLTSRPARRVSWSPRRVRTIAASSSGPRSRARAGRPPAGQHASSAHTTTTNAKYGCMSALSYFAYFCFICFMFVAGWCFNSTFFDSFDNRLPCHALTFTQPMYLIFVQALAFSSDGSVLAAAFGSVSLLSVLFIIYLFIQKLSILSFHLQKCVYFSPLVQQLSIALSHTHAGVHTHRLWRCGTRWVASFGQPCRTFRAMRWAVLCSFTHWLAQSFVRHIVCCNFCVKRVTWLWIILLPLQWRSQINKKKNQCRAKILSVFDSISDCQSDSVCAKFAIPYVCNGQCTVLVEPPLVHG